MQRQTELKKWLQSIFPDQSFELTFAAADADFRRYFRATFSDGQSIICMDAPPDKMSIAPYLKVQKLFDMVNVPQVLAADEALGFMALSDLGNTTFLAAIEHDEREIAHKALLLEAIDELVVLQKASRAGELPEYSREVMLREINLFPDWFVAKELGKTLNFKQRQWWQQTVDTLLPPLLAQPQVYVHRDFIVRNLMLTSGRPGVLDFQDALYGPISYDLVSLLRDAFIEWEEEFVLDLVIRYWEKARAAILSGAYFLVVLDEITYPLIYGWLPLDADFGAFYREFEWMGVQRHLKVAGIFARLYYRDGKDKYRPEIPRFLNYLRRAARRYNDLAPLYALLVDLVGDDELETGFTF